MFRALFPQITYSDLKTRINVRFRNKEKVFCVGFNKTGTTSLKIALSDLGYIIGNQREAELLSKDYIEDSFERIIHYCETAEAFQDVPFSLPHTYAYIDKAFPKSKFILTIRDNSEQWYNSLVSFHSKVYGENLVPTIDQLTNSSYVYKGWAWDITKKTYGISESDNPYDRELLIKCYEKHNKDVISYFKNRPNDLLVINVSDREAYQEICKFLKLKPTVDGFPWENKTSNFKTK